MDKNNSQVALVTGASSGIGEATAERLAQAGYTVYGTSRRGGQAGQRSFEMLPLDVTRDESVEAVVAEVMRRAGRIDLLVNNAGFGVAPAGAEESSLDQARTIFDTNFFGIVRMTCAVLPRMRQQRRGRIINIGSALGFLPVPYVALYSATKHAVAAYTESLDHELRTMGIRVSVVEPSYIKTSFDANQMQPDAPLDVYRAICEKIEKRVKEVLVPKGLIWWLRWWSRPPRRPVPKSTTRRAAPAVCSFSVGLRPPARWTPEFAKIWGWKHRQGKTMQAFLLEHYGKKSRVRLSDVPEPIVGDDDVLVKVHAAGVNLLDSKIKNGEFKPILPYRLPLILGHDVAGTVVKIGSRVRRFQPGDVVYSRPDDFRIGTFAELIAIKEGSLALKPETLTMEEAASLPLVGLTAWQAFVEEANLRKGQKVFIQAGSGGVGTFAIQLAKHLGAFVATTTSATNADWVKGLGADLVIDYKKDDFQKILKDYDVVLNSQDSKTLVKSLSVLKPGGKLISISGPPDPAFAETMGLPWYLKPILRLLSSGVRKKAKRHSVSYSFLFMKANGSQLREITALVDSGAIRPIVDRVFPFDATPEAMAYVETGRAKGKIVVRIA